MEWYKVGGIGRHGSRGSHVYVWCSGSVGAADWVRNFDTRRYGKLAGAKVNRHDLHEAFQIYFSLLRTYDFERMDGITIAGFSRGGAVAQALALVFALTHDKGLHTTLLLFASKRAGNRRFLQLVRERTQQIVATCYRGDIVPALPPWPLYRNFKHQVLGKLMWPWRAHPKSAAAAARVRKRMEEGMSDVYTEGG